MSAPLDHQEGWEAPRRLPLLAALATLVVLVVGLLLGGRLYNARIAPMTKPPRVEFPAPVLETGQTPPNERRTRHPPPPAGIAAAIRAAAAEGDTFWSRGK